MKRRRVVRYLAAGVSAVVMFTVVGCIRVSGGTWYVKSADTPEDWPLLTPVGEVQIKQYPAYRAAVVDEADLGDNGVEPMFMELFRHISSNEIAMTAPVDMGYDSADAGTARMKSMAFLYRGASVGELKDERTVRVRDFGPQTFASVGIRGDYTDANFQKGLGLLKAWLDSHPVEPAGSPRYLGYNGPFVPSFMRYGEVQIPVRDDR